MAKMSKKTGKGAKSREFVAGAKAQDPTTDEFVILNLKDIAALGTTKDGVLTLNLKDLEALDLPKGVTVELKVGARPDSRMAAFRHRKATSRKVLGTTKDGVSILKPEGDATHFTPTELDAAVASVRAADKA